MKLSYLLLITVLIVAIGCKIGQIVHSSTPGNELYKVTILYPSGEGKTFDMTYYETTHMPMLAGFIGKENLRFFEIDKGIAGRAAGEKAPYMAIGYFYVKDLTAYNNAIAANRDAVVNDIKNYTNSQPIIQISEVQKIGYAAK